MSKFDAYVIDEQELREQAEYSVTHIRGSWDVPGFPQA